MSGTLGSGLKEARRKSGLTQAQVAEALFVTRQTVSNWENDRSEPDLEMLRRLVELLAWDLEEAIGQEKKEEPEEINDMDAPAEVVQPQPEPRRMRWGLYLSAALLCLSLIVGAVGLAREWQPDYSPEWFAQSVALMEDQSLVEMYVRPDQTPEENLVRNGVCSWKFALVLREEGGVGVQVEELRAVYFFEGGMHHIVTYDKETLARKWQSSHMDRYGMLRYVMAHEHDAALQLKGVGIHVLATDDKNNALEFREYYEKNEI